MGLFSLVYFSHMFGRIIVGALFMAAGIFMVWKTEMVFRWTGSITWAEAKLGVGQTRFFLKLIGLALTFIGIGVVTNLHAGVLQAFAGLFIRT